MAEPLKYVYNYAFFLEFTNALEELNPSIDKKAFLSKVTLDPWVDLELKQRMTHLAHALRTVLDSDLKTSMNQVVKISRILKDKKQTDFSFEYMFLPEYISIYGLEHPEESVLALESITKFASAEFAVRPLIKRYPDYMLKTMAKWAKNDHQMVRRLASEGFRPRLPWAMALPDFKASPLPLLDMLNRLVDDGSETVRKSVANNLNDIAKDHPHVVIDYVKKNINTSERTRWVCKHASRTLLKAGNQEILELFGLGYKETMKVSGLKLKTSSISLGEYLEFEFTLENKAKESAIMRLEYAIYYQKANGTLSRKVYKISEKAYESKTRLQIKRKQPFKPISTRVFHPGLHELSIILNGRELSKLGFTLKVS